MIDNFWTWIYNSVNAALSTLNTIYENETMNPFFNLFLVVVAIAVIMKFIVQPMLGNSGSDKVKGSKEDEE